MLEQPIRPIFLAVLLLFSSASVFADEVQTHYGMVSATQLKAPKDGYALTFDGKNLASYAVDDVSLLRVQTPLNSPAYVIVEKTVPGLNCRHEYVVLQIAPSGKVLLSGDFGDCMELQGTTLAAGSMSVILRSPVIKGVQQHSEEWVWMNGKLSKRDLAETSATEAFDLYLNERYGYQISHPVSFVAHGVSDSGDGQVFTSPANDAELAVYSSTCTKGSNLTPGDYVLSHQQEQKAGKLTVSYTRKGKDFSVVSGNKGKRIFYHKLITRNEWCTQFNFEYDQAEKAKYDLIAGRIAASFKP